MLNVDAQLHIESFRIFTNYASFNRYVHHLQCHLFAYFCCITGRSEFWNVWVQVVLELKTSSAKHCLCCVEAQPSVNPHTFQWRYKFLSRLVLSDEFSNLISLFPHGISKFCLKLHNFLCHG